MSGSIQIETGHTGRVVYARIRPNEDLVLALEKLCVQEGICNGILRGSLGSLTDAKIVSPEGKTTVLRGPAVEVLSISGEIRSDEYGSLIADLRGMICAPDGTMAGGRFVRGENPVCVTFEIAVEEWIVTGEDRS